MIPFISQIGLRDVQIIAQSAEFVIYSTNPIFIELTTHNSHPEGIISGRTENELFFDIFNFVVLPKEPKWHNLQGIILQLKKNFFYFSLFEPK